MLVKVRVVVIRCQYFRVVKRWILEVITTVASVARLKTLDAQCVEEASGSQCLHEQQKDGSSLHEEAGRQPRQHGHSQQRKVGQLLMEHHRYVSHVRGVEGQARHGVQYWRRWWVEMCGR